MELSIAYKILLRNHATVKITLILITMIAVITALSSTYAAIKQRLEAAASATTPVKERVIYLGNAEAPAKEGIVVIPAVAADTPKPSIGCKAREILPPEQVKITYRGQTITATPLKKCYGDIRDYALLLPQNHTRPQTAIQLAVYGGAPASMLLSRLMGTLDALFNTWLLLAVAAVSITGYIAKPQIDKAIKEDISSIETLFGKKPAEKIKTTIPLLAAILAIPTGLFIGHMASSATSMLLAALGYPEIRPRLDPRLPLFLTALLATLSLVPHRE